MSLYHIREAHKQIAMQYIPSEGAVWNFNFKTAEVGVGFDKQPYLLVLCMPAFCKAKHLQESARNLVVAYAVIR